MNRSQTVLQLAASGGPGELLSIIVPVLNEQAVLAEFYERLCATIDSLPVQVEVIFVNDGSDDATAAMLQALRRHDGRIGLLSLSRRFGKEIAISAGLDQARGSAIIFIDADLQDPPERIPDMLAAWQSGYDVVAMQRADRSCDSWFKRSSAAVFYRLLGKLSSVEIPQGVGDFRLISRRVADALRALPERNRYMKGLFAWVGYSYVELPYKRAVRHAGDTKWPFAKLFGLAVDGITAFSIAPLRLASFAGLLTSAVAFFYAAVVFVRTVFYGDPVAGYPTLMITMTFLGGMQLLSIGLLGEYVGRMFVETKQRPLYLVDSMIPARSAKANDTVAERMPRKTSSARQQSVL